MAYDYYWRGDNDEDEVIIQAVDDRLSVRVTEYDDEASTFREPTVSSMVYLSVEEIDRMIAGLEAAKKRILSRR